MRARLVLTVACLGIAVFWLTPSAGADMVAEADTAYAYARFGACDPAKPASSEVRVWMFSPDEYDVRRTQPVNGKCYSLYESHASDDASVFYIAPDLTAAELVATTTNFGTIHVTWDAKGGSGYNPLNGTGAWGVPSGLEPLPPDAGVWFEIQRAADSSLRMRGISARAKKAYVASGGGIYR